MSTTSVPTMSVSPVARSRGTCIAPIKWPIRTTGIDDLAKSVAVSGVIEPLIVVATDGSRPWSAARTRSQPLRQRRGAKDLTSADDDHPWPDELGTGVFGQRIRVAITKVRPVLVLGMAADPPSRCRRYRHALRYLRLRSDMDPTDVEAPV
jgi:hypothetical protein